MDLWSGKETEEMPESVPKPQSNCFCCFYSSYKRFVALIFMGLTVFFYAANYDMPGSMRTEVETTFSVLPYEYELLYSVYSLPNIIICFFSGLLIDKVLGLPLGSFVFAAVALLGQILITLGGFTHYYYLMLIGRFICGIGLESISLALCCYSVVWFKNKELSFVFGLLTSLTRLGSLFASLAFNPVHRYVQTFASQNLVFGTSITLFLLVAIALVLTIAFLAYYTKTNCKKQLPSDSKHTAKITDVLDFSLTYWFILILSSVCINAIFSFISISQDLLKMKYNINQDTANYLSNGFNLISALLCPIPGFFVDKIGKNMYVILCGMVIGLISQLIMALTTWTPVIPLTLFAAFYAILNSCTWTLIEKVVKPYQLGTAYGTFQCFINLVGIANDIIAGYFLQIFGPNGVSLLFLCDIAISIFFCLLVLLIDGKGKGYLNKSPAQIKVSTENFYNLSSH